MNHVESSQNVANVRKAYDAFNRSDFDAVMELMQPDVELQRVDQAPELEPLRGAEAVRAWMLPDIFASQRAEPFELIENGNRIFVALRFRVRAAGSGIEVEDSGFHVWTLRDGKAASGGFYSNRSEALEAAGLAPTAQGPTA